MNDDQRQRLIFHMRRLSVELDRLGHEFAKQHGLHPTDVRALLTIMDAARGGEPVSPGDLARRLNLTSASVTALLDRLEANRHVRRAHSARDRRRVTLEISDEAQELGRRFFTGINRELTAAMGAFDARELDVVERFLVTMTGVVQARLSTGDDPRPPRTREPS